MKKQLISTLAILALVPATLALACTEDGMRGLAPDNSLFIPTNSGGKGDQKSNVTEAQFKASIARAEKIYAPVFKAQGRTYTIIPEWNDGTVNAYANRKEMVSEVHMFGGLARHPKMSPDGFELVICHETGHHLGGAPKTRSFFGKVSWASNEGEADYYATLKCAREMWKDDDNATIVAKLKVPAIVVEKCQKSFDRTNEILICERSAMAAKDLADTLGDMNKSMLINDFEKPDPKVVRRMFDGHPQAQCRLDTYFAGAICAKAKEDALSETDPTVGTCAQEKGDTLGIRPLCWYLPYDPNRPQGGSVWPSSRLSQR